MNAGARLTRPAPADAPPPYWNAWARLDELEAFVAQEKAETMDKVAELQAAIARLAAVNRTLLETLAAQRAQSSNLSAQLSALQPPPLQPLIDQANAAAAEGEAAIGAASV